MSRIGRKSSSVDRNKIVRAAERFFQTHYPTRNHRGAAQEQPTPEPVELPKKPLLAGGSTRDEHGRRKEGKKKKKSITESRINAAMTVDSFRTRSPTSFQHLVLSPLCIARQKSHGWALSTLVRMAETVLSIEMKTMDRNTTLAMMISTINILRHWRATTFLIRRNACLAVTVRTLELYDGKPEALSEVAVSSKSDLMYTLMQYPKVVNCKMAEIAAKFNSGPQ